MHVPSRSRGEAISATIACVDLGKTSCRVRIVDADDARVRFEHHGHGAPGLAEARGAMHAAQSIDDSLQDIPLTIRQELSAIVIGAAGTEAAPNAAQDLARHVALSYGKSATVSSDVVIAHAGALRGSPGTVLIVGTGAVALSLLPDGTFRQADGWGPWVGDEGSGRWIGQQGIRLGVRSLDGRGPQTQLAAAVSDMIGTPYDVPGWVSSGDHPARTLATFAQIVLDLADAGDAQSSGIVSRAIDALVESVRAASAPYADVAIIGGIAQRSSFRVRLESRLSDLGLVPLDDVGSPLEGALLLATESEGPYEKKVFHAAN